MPLYTVLLINKFWTVFVFFFVLFGFVYIVLYFQMLNYINSIYKDRVVKLVNDWLRVYNRNMEKNKK